MLKLNKHLVIIKDTCYNLFNKFDWNKKKFNLVKSSNKTDIHRDIIKINAERITDIYVCRSIKRSVE